MKKSPKFYLTRTYAPQWASAEVFSGGKNDILLVTFSFQVADDATQTDVRKTLYPFCAIKKMPHVMATIANRVSSKKIYTE